MEDTNQSSVKGSGDLFWHNHKEHEENGAKKGKKVAQEAADWLFDSLSSWWNHTQAGGAAGSAGAGGGGGKEGLPTLF